MRRSRNGKYAADREKWAAWGASFALHILLFGVLAFFGVFSLFQPSSDNLQTVEVALYDADAGGGGEPAPSAGGSAEGAGVDISLPSDADLPAIHEDYTKSPEKQEEYRQKHQQKTDSSAEDGKKNSPDAKALTDGKDSGSGQEKQGTQGTGGNGNSSAPNAGNGSGGNGSGGGDGSKDSKEAGNGRDAAAAQRPKTPPQLLQSQNPRYPRDLEDQGIGGTVLLSLLVGSDGSVQSVSVAASSGYAALDAAAVDAGYGYRFLPARNVYDEPVACRISKRIIFQP